MFWVQTCSMEHNWPLQLWDHLWKYSQLDFWVQEIPNKTPNTKVFDSLIVRYHNLREMLSDQLKLDGTFEKDIYFMVKAWFKQNSKGK